MTALLTARIVAVILATVMIVYLVTSGAVRGDNPFLVPDLLLSVVLLVTACLPARWAPPAFLFAFGLATGVWTTSLSHYAVRDELVDGLDHLPLIAACVIQSFFVARTLRSGALKAPAAPRREPPGRRRAAGEPAPHQPLPALASARRATARRRTAR